MNTARFPCGAVGGTLAVMGGGLGQVLNNSQLGEWGLVGVVVAMGLIIAFRAVISQFIKRTLFGRGRDQDRAPSEDGQYYDDRPRRRRRRRY